MFGPIEQINIKIAYQLYFCCPWEFDNWMFMFFVLYLHYVEQEFVFQSTLIIQNQFRYIFESLKIETFFSVVGIGCFSVNQVFMACNVLVVPYNWAPAILHFFQKSLLILVVMAYQNLYFVGIRSLDVAKRI